LQNVEDVVTLLHKHLSSQVETSYTRERRTVTHTFWHVKKLDVDLHTTYTCDTTKGSQNIHLVRFVGNNDVNKLLKKDFACFYCHCLDGNFITCVNLA
jgi:hypothetical protein